MDRTIIITGASDGIGAAAARTLAKRGENVVVIGRSPEKVARVAADVGGDSFVADFSRLDEVRDLAAQLLDRYPRIDVLVNNAGGVFAERTTTVDGHELTLQVNHLAPFLLTNLLLDRLITSKASVVNTASTAHLRGRIDLSDVDLTTKWSAWRAYSNSKLANVLFTRGLHRRFVLQGVSTASFHPGVVASNFGASSGGLTKWFYASALGKRLLIDSDAGADTLIWLAEGTPPRDWASGLYYDKRRPAKIATQARDDRFVDAFWDVSAELVR